MVQALCFVLLAAAAPQQGSAPDEKEVRELAERLNADDVAARAQAEADLIAIGEAVVPILEKLKPQAGAEARGRIENVIADVTLARRWLKDLSEEPDPGQAYQKLEEAFRSKVLDRRQLARIVNHALLSDAGENLRQYMFSAVERHKLREVWPALVQLAMREENDSHNAISYLQRIKPPKEAADEVLKLLPRIRNRSSFHQLLELVISLRPDRAKLDAAVLALLEEGADDELRMNLMNSIQSGRLNVSLKTALCCWRGSRASRQSYGREAVLRIPPDGSVNEVIGLLGSAEQDEVILAAEYAARHRLAQAAVPLAEAIEKHLAEDRWASPGNPAWAFQQRAYYGPDGQVKPKLLQALKAIGAEALIRSWLAAPGGKPSRAVVAALIGELEIRTLGGDLAGLLDDKDPKVRREAARAAAALKLDEAASPLEARLKDEDVTVRVIALQSLAKIRGAAATATVLAQLRADHPDVRAAAAGLLPQMDLDAVLNELTRPESLGQPFLRYALAVVISSGGDAAMHRVMARAGDRLSVEDLLALVRLVQAARGR